MTYNEALAYIFGVRSKCQPSLERITRLMHNLGDPQEKLKFIHVGGTNGKGSCCAMLASVLQKAGYHVGLYTSPHINIFRERIQLDGAMISEEELVSITEEIKHVVEETQQELTEFDLITAIALKYYAKIPCDIVVTEVGMGGTLDSTNIIPTPELTILTSMGFDHVGILGRTMEDIASAKAGIIKKGTSVVTYGNDPIALRVFQRVSHEFSCPCTVPAFDAIQVENQSLEGQTFSYKEHKHLFLPLAGSYQPKNASLVLEGLSILKSKGWKISEQNIIDGMKEVSWPARFEVISRDPVFIVDGGHNPHGIIGTAEGLRSLFPQGNIQFIIGLMSDKDWQSMLEQLYPLADCFYTTAVGSPRSLSPEDLAKGINHSGKGKAIACISVEEAVEKAKEAAGKDGTCCALGSLYLAGMVRSAITGIPNEG